MATPVLIVGHKNPDNDSIAGAVGFAYYKNEMMKRTLAQNPDAEEFEYIPCRLGPLPEESEAFSRPLRPTRIPSEERQTVPTAGVGARFSVALVIPP